MPTDDRVPRPERVDVVDAYFGVGVPDPYRYLEDVDDSRSAQWSNAQDELFAAAATTWSGRDDWAEQVEALLGAGGVGPPIWRGDRYFFSRRLPGEQLPSVLVAEAGGTPRILVDPIALDPSGLTTLDSWQPSKEGTRLAYQMSTGGTEESNIWVIDVTSGAVVEGPIDRARYSPIAWLPGGQSYFYVRRLAPADVPDGEEQFHRRVYLHSVGADPVEDVEIFGAGREITEYYGVSVDRTGRWLTLSAANGTAPRNDLWVADISGDVGGSTPAAPALRLVQAGVDARTDISVGRDGMFYVFTDRDAPRRRLAVVTPEHVADCERWLPLLSSEDAVLEDVAILDGPEIERPVLLASWTTHAVASLTRHDLRTGALLGSVSLPGLGSIGGIVERPSGGAEVWFSYTDHITVGSVLRYDERDGSASVWAEAPGQVDVPEVVVTQEAFTAPDGTTVHLFLLSPAGIEPDVVRPTILTGYGGFGHTATPGFAATMLAWVAAGGRYAVAGLRGGAEEGEQWHRDGRREHKQNTFDDFTAAARHLIASGATSSDHLAIEGGSNGGLLVGAAMTQHPELFAAVICVAPLLDMVRYELHGLGRTWNDEYGTAADATEFAWLHAYSPYHHVVDGVAYPATLLVVFNGDTRVDPLHARKFTAALQHSTSSFRPILLRAESQVGHGGRSLDRSVALSADVLAFAATWTGLAPESDR